MSMLAAISGMATAASQASNTAIANSWLQIEGQQAYRHATAASNFASATSGNVAGVYDRSQVYAGPTHSANTSNLMNAYQSAISNMQGQANANTSRIESQQSQDKAKIDTGMAIGSLFGPLGTVLGGMIGWSQGSNSSASGSNITPPTVTTDPNTGFMNGQRVDPNTQGSHNFITSETEQANQNLQEAADNYNQDTINTNLHLEDPTPPTDVGARVASGGDSVVPSEPAFSDSNQQVPTDKLPVSPDHFSAPREQVQSNIEHTSFETNHYAAPSSQPSSANSSRWANPSQPLHNTLQGVNTPQRANTMPSNWINPNLQVANQVMINGYAVYGQAPHESDTTPLTSEE